MVPDTLRSSYEQYKHVRTPSMLVGKIEDTLSISTNKLGKRVQKVIAYKNCNKVKGDKEFFPRYQYSKVPLSPRWSTLMRL